MILNEIKIRVYQVNNYKKRYKLAIHNINLLDAKCFYQYGYCNQRNSKQNDGFRSLERYET